MTDRDKQDRAEEHLEQSVSSGKISADEAKVIKLFFASKPEKDWPASNLHRRMQGSGG
ncbi:MULTISPECIES: hypothetical protein [unclassified Bradyrhizobium]|uniref:hypothetical protein n=1 Tax=unclassified Bradyrhizobium TaxID=2631580 RepID=UPI0028F0D7B3|nr:MULTISPECIES: hypothetical protein [unclassified Bradyrhizobium]